MKLNLLITIVCNYTETPLKNSSISNGIEIKINFRGSHVSVEYTGQKLAKYSVGSSVIPNSLRFTSLNFKNISQN